MPEKAASDALDLFQESVTKIIRPSLADWAEAAGLQQSSHEFDEEVIKAICGCLIQHSFSQRSLRMVRKEISITSKKAQAASKSLAELHEALKHLSLESRMLLTGGELVSFHLETLQAEAASFDRLSASMKRSADLMKAKDEGGRQAVMIPFQVLVKGLATPFKRATGHEGKVTWDPYCGAYKGNFVLLVEAVLPFASAIAASGGRHLTCPATPKARGRYIHGVTRVPRMKGTRGRRSA
jgi:hypothetical protein